MGTSFLTAKYTKHTKVFLEVGLRTHTQLTDRNTSAGKTGRMIRTIRTTGTSYHDRRRVADCDNRIVLHVLLVLLVLPARRVRGRSFAYAPASPPAVVCGGRNLSVILCMRPASTACTSVPHTRPARSLCSCLRTSTPYFIFHHWSRSETRDFLPVSFASAR